MSAEGEGVAGDGRKEKGGDYASLSYLVTYYMPNVSMASKDMEPELAYFGGTGKRSEMVH